MPDVVPLRFALVLRAVAAVTARRRSAELSIEAAVAHGDTDVDPDAGFEVDVEPDDGLDPNVDIDPDFADL